MRYIGSMDLDRETCYQAVLSRDRRFDGWFFVAVTSTGIYCRPVCPVRPPKLTNCRFYANAALVEHAGFRPCLRCRPPFVWDALLYSLTDHAIEGVERVAGRSYTRVVDIRQDGRHVTGWLQAEDLPLRHALRRAAHWAPWRAYAAQHLALIQEEKAHAA
jgi:hypothetical protein